MRKKKIAAEFAPDSNMVQILDTGVVMERAEAEALGYDVSAEIGPAERNANAPRTPTLNIGPANGPALVKLGWRKEIMSSPEARGRDSAVAEILVKHSPETLSADNARAFLRGLPIEQSERKETMTQNNVDPRAARQAEIAANMRAFNRENGNGRANVAAGNNSAKLASVDPVKLKRLAEIRLNALESGQAQDLQGNATSRNETTKLRYALQVHGQTGKPLAEVFAQLGVDTSKIVR
jgi:hypothetical protein